MRDDSISPTPAQLDSADHCLFSTSDKEDWSAITCIPSPAQTAHAQAGSEEEIAPLVVLSLNCRDLSLIRRGTDVTNFGADQIRAARLADCHSDSGE